MVNQFILKAVVLVSFSFSSYTIAQVNQTNQMNGINLPSNIKVLTQPNLATPGIAEGENPRSAVITPIPVEATPPSEPTSAASAPKTSPQSQVQDIGFREKKESQSNVKTKQSTGLEQYNKTSIEYYDQWGKKEENAKIKKFYSN